MNNQASTNFSNVLSFIDSAYLAVGRLQPLNITAYGPPRPDEKPTDVRVVNATGKQLKHASSNPKQGRWLADLASSVASPPSPTCIVEIGTCVGISGMYLLAGMARSGGGHLVTFEGSPELAKIAKGHFDDLLSSPAISNVSYSIIEGPLDKTFSQTISNIDKQINLAFIDGNHQEDSTLEYHKELRPKMTENGVIIHDDIAWGEGMARAWQEIVKLESAHRIEELLLGWRPNRGVIRLGQPSTGSITKYHTDGFFGRVARVIKKKVF